MNNDNPLPYDWAKNHLLSSINPHAYAFFNENLVTRDLAFGDAIFENEAPVQYVVFPHEGVISCVSEPSLGRTVEKASIGREGFLGLTSIFGGGVTFGKYVVQVPGRASWMSVENLDIALDQFHCVRGIILRYAKAFTTQLMESVACNSLHTAKQRIARWLMEAHDRVEGDTFYITQETLGNLLALRRATVNAVCSELMSGGGIDYHRGSLTIVDKDRLKLDACSCYDRIKNSSINRQLPHYLDFESIK
jgi:CRP-like cAMP-binding protein